MMNEGKLTVIMCKILLNLAAKPMKAGGNGR
jgi:hypothetical protein